MPRYTKTLVCLMMAQAILGLVWSSAYRDPDRIKATWFGNDWITLAIATPVLWLSGGRPRSPVVLNWCGSIQRGLIAFPGELPIWVPLTVFTWIAALLLLKQVHRRDVVRP